MAAARKVQTKAVKVSSTFHNSFFIAGRHDY
jgi:hypothetical protein